MSEQKKGKLKKIVNDIIVVLLVMLIAVLLVIVIQNRSNGTTPSIAGYQIYIVKSGSMEPALKVGSLVVVKKAALDEIKSGDIITFGSGDEIATHRVVEVLEEGAQRSFQTKGDANEVTDPVAVSVDNLIGRAIFNIPYAGFVLQYTKTHPQLAYFIMLPAFLLLLWEVLSCFYKKKRQAEKS